VHSDEQFDVALAVNGTIGSWAEVQSTNRGRRFWGVVPPDLLREDGEDEIAVYRIEGSGPDPTLVPLTPA